MWEGVGMPGLPPCPSVMELPPPWAAAALGGGRGHDRFRGLYVRGGSTYDYPPPLHMSPSYDEVGSHHPPVGVVVGAGAVGALTGHLMFHSLLISVGLGVGAMGVAASAEGYAGDLARSSGRMALAAFERTVEVNERYHLTDRVARGVQSAGQSLREFDREHAVVHNATEGAKRAWRSLRKFDETHELTTRAGNVVSSGLDKLAQVLEPPVISTTTTSTNNGISGDRSGRDLSEARARRDKSSRKEKQSARPQPNLSEAPVGGVEGGWERGGNLWEEDDPVWRR